MANPMNKIPITYLCWGCGSLITTYEDTDLPIPSMEIWNICIDCQKRLSEKGVQNND